MLNPIFSILALSLITCGASAATVVNCTSSECPQSKVILDESVQELQAGMTTAFGNVVMKDATSEKYCSDVGNTDGICYMTQQKAIQYCAFHHSHLPSAREMGQLTASFGAKGIVDSCENDANCDQIAARNFLKPIDQFNFSYSGYRGPEGELGNVFWSSSRLPNLAYIGLAFDGGFGGLRNVNSNRYAAAVLCVVGR